MGYASQSGRAKTDPKNPRAFVYLVTNTVNGKRYIGATTGPLSKRKAEHKCAAKRRNPCERNIIFYKAIRKYGFENFNFVSLIECEPEKIFFEEIRMIALLKPEYNGTRGGEGGLGRKMSAYTRKRLAEGRVRNAHKIKETLSKLGKEKDNLIRFSKYRHMGAIAMSKKVVCLDDGIIHESARAAGRHYGICSGMITELCLRNPRRVAAKGLVFRYFGDHQGGAEEADRVRKVKKINLTRNSKKILCVEDNRVFHSLKDAGEFYKVSASVLGQVCSGRYKTSRGKRFVFYTAPSAVEAA